MARTTWSSRIAAITSLGLVAVLTTVAAAPAGGAADPQLLWATQTTGAGTYFSASGNSVVLDSVGNVYVAGTFEGSVDFDPGPGVVNLTAENPDGNPEGFVQKLDPAGNLVWAKHISSTVSSTIAGVAVDTAGNVYTTGGFHGTADLDPGAGVLELTSGANDLFVQKLDPSGAFVWATQVSATTSASALGVAVDGVGNVYTTGAFEGTVDFDPGVGVFDLSSGGDRDVYLQKLDTNGGFTWAIRTGGSDLDLGRAVTVDAAGNVFATGRFEGTVDFDPGPGVLNITAMNPEGFVQKLDSAGGLVWAKHISSTVSSSIADVAVSAAGDVHLVGSFTGTADFDPGIGIFDLTSPGSNSDAFVQKLDANGGFAWATRTGGVSFDGASGVAVDEDGNVYAAGNFRGAVDFDPGAGVFELTSMGADGDAFVQMLDPSGGFQAAVKTGASSLDLGYGRANAVALDDGSGVFTTGRFSGTVDFDPDPIETLFLSEDDNAAAFVWKMRFAELPALVPGVAAVAEGDAGSGVAAVPVTLTDASSDIVTVDWSTVDWTANAPGDYATASGTLEFSPGETSKTIPIVVNGDVLHETDEVLGIVFSNAVNATIGGFMGVGLVVINDNDPQPTVSPGGFVASEGDSGASLWNLPLTLSAPAGIPVSVDYSTLDIPTNPLVAHPGSDYLAASGTVTFAPGETVKNIEIEVLGDTVDEPALLFGEWGLVQLSNPVSTTVTGGLFGLGLFIIIDDDTITSEYSMLTAPGTSLEGGVFASDGSIPGPYLEFVSGELISDGGGTITEGVGVDWYIDEVLFRDQDNTAPFELSNQLGSFPIGVPFNGEGPAGSLNEFLLEPGTHTVRAEAFYPGGTKNFIATFTVIPSLS